MGENENGLLSKSVNAKIIGSGREAMVLAHGFGADQSLWDKIVPKLSQEYRVVVFDWTFSGSIKDPNLFDPKKYSSYSGFAEDLIALLDELGLTSTIFLGHSMSGLIGCLAYTKRPDLFQTLILLCSSPRYFFLSLPFFNSILITYFAIIITQLVCWCCHICTWVLLKLVNFIQP